MGAIYFGGYIRDDESKYEWLKERVDTWDQKICTIRKTAGKYPEESYATVVRAIQLEWIFLQNITTNMGDMFAGVETMIQETFFTRILLGNKKTPITHIRIYKYNDGQAIWLGSPEYSDVSKQEIPKFEMCKHIFDSICDRGRHISQ